jgi:hypothetical protein
MIRIGQLSLTDSYIQGGPMTATIKPAPAVTLADTIANALHKHIPDWRGAFDEQLAAIARDVMAAHGNDVLACLVAQPRQDRYQNTPGENRCAEHLGHELLTQHTVHHAPRL